MDFHIELVHLKDEIFKELKKLDTKFTKLHKQQSDNISEDVLTPLDKINIMLQKTEQMFNSVTEQQLKLDKITELETFKNRINDTVLAHEIRIKSLLKDLEDISFKYDKEITQNLTVPGFIGMSCRFKTISEYLLFNIDDITKLKMEKELMKKEEKDLKAKLDSMIKNVLILVDNSVKRSNLYTDNKQKTFEDNFENKYKEFNDKIMEMKTSALTNEKFVKEEIIKITKLANELNYLKQNVETVFDKKTNEIKVSINELKNKYDKINNEVKKNHKNLDNINNILKINGISNDVNHDNKNKMNPGKKISMIKKADINNNYYNINNSYKNNKFVNNNRFENTISINQKNSNSFKKKPSKEINNYLSQNIIEKKSSNEYFKNFERIMENNTKNNNQNNIKTHNELKYKMNPKYINKNEINKNNYNDNDKIESYNLERKIPTERKSMNMDKKKFRENIKEDNTVYNSNPNFTDDEKEKKYIDANRKKRNVTKNKINKFKLIKIDKNPTINKFEKDKIDKKILTYTENNFYNKKELNDFHYYKNEIYNLKRLPFHKIYKYENLDDNSNKANSDLNIDINIDSNRSNQLQSPQKVNNIYYPNEEVIKNLKHKDSLLNQFLIRHNTNYNNKSDIKFQKLLLYDENNITNETINNIYNNTDLKNRANTLEQIKPINSLIRDNELSVNKKDVETQSKLSFRNEKIPERLNFKFISLDNQFKMALNKKKIKLRNNQELLLSTPITNVFKTFQMKKSKEIINNKNIFNVGKSFNNKNEENKVNNLK